MVTSADAHTLAPADTAGSTAPQAERMPRPDGATWSHSRVSSYFWMRSAGFPFELLDALEMRQDSALLERHEALIDSIATAETLLLDMVAADSPGALPKLQRKFREGLPVSATDMPASVRERSHPWFQRRLADLGACQAQLPALQQAFAQAQAGGRRRLVEALSSPEAREALFLSNPESLQRIDALIATFAQPQVQVDSRTRQRLRLAWNYLQRLCAKNDTCSFFGPITWGQVDRTQDRPLLLQSRPGPWLAQRESFFEHWVVLRLSQALYADPSLQDALPLRLGQGCHLQGEVLHYPLARHKRLQGSALALLRALAGAPAQGISRAELLDTLQAQGHAADECAALLAFFQDKGVTEAALQIAPGQCTGPGALQRLKQGLGTLRAPASVLGRWMALIDALEADRQQFAHGDLDTRRQALDALSGRLSQHGIDLSRATGKMYVGRFPLYEDCGRNLSVTLSGGLADELQQSMEPVMQLHHWLAGAAAARLHAHYLALWRQLSGEAGQAVDFLQFHQLMHRSSSTEDVIQGLRQGLRAAWQEVLPDSAAAGDEIRLQAADLQRLLEALHRQEPAARDFPGFALGVHSPDFMLAAEDEQALARGDYQWIIGEVHPAVHTLSQPVAQPFCPHQEAIRAEVDALLQPATAVLADSPESYQRSHIDWLDVESLHQVVLPGSVARVPAERCIPAGRGEVVLAADTGILHFQDRETGFQQDLLTLVPSEMHRACFALAADLLGHALSPRLVLGRLVVKRRSWNVQPEDLPPLAQSSDELQGFLAWRQWARRHGIPRHAFVKLSGEPKPIYVDFANPASIDLLATLCKTPQAMRVSEMRPTPQELWLRDGRGRYCAEFRTSFVAHRSAQARERAP